MNAGDASGSALLYFGFAFLVPFVICLLLSRRGHALTAWWLPGGILVMTLMFVGAGVWLSGEIQTGIGAARTLGLLAVPGIVGGVAGILLGRRSA